MNKKTKTIIGCIVFTVLILTLLMYVYNNDTAKNEIATNETITETIENHSNAIDQLKIAGEQCFYRSQGMSPDLQDLDVVRLIVDPITHTVRGNYAWIPAEKDSARGTIAGSVDNTGLIRTQYTYMIEGSNQIEQWNARFTDTGLSIGTGQRTEDLTAKITTLNFVDETKLMYDQLLPTVNCDDLTTLVPSVKPVEY